MPGRSSGFIALVVTAMTFCAAEARAQESPRHAGSDNTIAIEHAEIILAPSGAKMMAGYLTIWNGAQQQANLSSVQSDAFASVSLHRTEIVDGIAKLRSIDAGLSIPGHSELFMKPGGVHMMLMGPRAELKPGDGVDLLLKFQDGTTASAKAVVRPMGQKPTDHHHGKDDQQEEK
ncbi:exported hypothetical protein [Mesorhizobium metallidurans STM 2683]|uniref:Copper chaperone PCu(A)C n=1 Tax=Mesorhizobium metallidurans STM 2683 TaxID=1297569 RepID=M5EVY6_9HYPH|nr:copper chaperone PCu(A)C [Mesorhizobium metallidurans]CCV08382.1 exported hypothetical protein [Mesorhizobium metallidurans STM 2683]